MCIAAVSGIASAAGSATNSGLGIMNSSVAGYNEGKLQKKQFEYQAQIMDNSAQTARWMADNAAARGNAAQEEQRQRVSRVEGAGRAAYGASGVVIGKGSALDWQQDLQVQAEYDRSKIQYNADMEAWGYNNQAQNDQTAASNFRLAGKNAYKAGRDNAVFSLLNFLSGPMGSSAGIKATSVIGQYAGRTAPTDLTNSQNDYYSGAKYEAKSWYDTTGGKYTGSYEGPGSTMNS